MSSLNAIQLLAKAKKKETIQIEFDLTGGDGPERFPVLLTMSALDGIIREQRVAYFEALTGYERFKKQPIDEDSWNTYLKNIEKEKDKKWIEENRPKSLAEQLADIDTRTVIHRKLFPKYALKKNGGLAFPTPAEQRAFGELCMSTPSLSDLLNKKFIEIGELIKKSGEGTKNS